MVVSAAKSAAMVLKDGFGFGAVFLIGIFKK